MTAIRYGYIGLIPLFQQTDMAKSRPLVMLIQKIYIYISYVVKSDIYIYIILILKWVFSYTNS